MRCTADMRRWVNLSLRSFMAFPFFVRGSSGGHLGTQFFVECDHLALFAYRLRGRFMY
jgi:hypothetical protein